MDWDSASGSSPRGRGKLDGSVSLTLTSGLIPAWAGKTDLVGLEIVSHEAHPRVGGENRLV